MQNNRRQLRCIGSARQSKQHSSQRAEERYGLTLSNKKRKQITALIEEGRCNFLRHGSMPMREVYGLTFEGQRLRVVYDRYVRRIVTFLPNGEKEK